MSAADYLGVGEDDRCLGCRNYLDTFNPDCPVCLADMETLADWGEDGIDPEVAKERLRKALAASPPWVACPKCHVEVQDLDGFGVLVHEPCGYCSHPDVCGDTCTGCGQIIAFVGYLRDDA